MLIGQEVEEVSTSHKYDSRKEFNQFGICMIDYWHLSLCLFWSFVSHLLEVDVARKLLSQLRVVGADIGELQSHLTALDEGRSLPVSRLSRQYWEATASHPTTANEPNLGIDEKDSFIKRK